MDTTRPWCQVNVRNTVFKQYVLFHRTHDANAKNVKINKYPNKKPKIHLTDI